MSPSHEPSTSPPSVAVAGESNTQLLSISQEHYLKKYLLTSLINAEIDQLQKNPYETLPNLGGPFDPRDEYANSSTPFLRYLFESMVVPFPFLTTSRGALWPKLQQFLDEWAKAEAGNGIEREEMIRRKRLKNKGERTIVLMYSMAIKTTEQRASEKKGASMRQEQRAINSEASLVPSAISVDEVREPNPLDDISSAPSLSHPSSPVLQSRLGRLRLSNDAEDSNHLQVNSSHRSGSGSRSRSASPAISANRIHGVRINVVGVRVVKEKRHVREHEHAEFIVASVFPDGREYVVARRHGRFRRLYLNIRQAFPQLELPVPPAKYVPKRSGSSGEKAAREKDRISLRGYMHNLAKIGRIVVDSPVFTQFLTKGAVDLTEEEMKDVQKRIELDENRMAQQVKFDKEVAAKVEELDKQLKEVKEELLQPGGISRLFSAFKHIDNVNDLPPLYRTVFEWGCMNFASTLYHVFTSSDDATLNFTQLKRTHMLLPYRAMWGLLKISNPMAMMKGIMDLFLAQPFGSRSLMQRIISGNIQEEVSEYKREVSDLESSIDDSGLCEKIRNYVYAPRSVLLKIFPEGDEPYDITELSLVMDVLRSDQILPVLKPAQIQRVWSAQQQLESERLERRRQRKGRLSAVAELEDSISTGSGSDSDSGPSSSSSTLSLASSRASMDEKESAALGAPEHSKYLSKEKSKSKDENSEASNLIQQLQQLLVAHLRIRDKERMINLVFQGVTGEILKEAISIFYQPLVKVYKSANVADSLFDVKDFVDELIKIVEQSESGEDAQKEGSPTVATLYLNLVRKHLPSFYKFVHAVHSEDDGIFQDLLGWIDSIITFMRTGFGHRRVDYSTGEELRLGVDLDRFIKESIPEEDWRRLQDEAEELRKYFSEVKDRKKEKIRRMAGLDRESRSRGTMDAGFHDEGEAIHDVHTQEQLREHAGQQRIAQELRDLGLYHEDVDELELLNTESVYDSADDTGGHDDKTGGAPAVEGEEGVRIPKVPTVERLLDPFVQLMDKALFQTARE
ncbi:hypothetical protein BGW38_006015 [Lunasporangiospora selenospora]|uniref:PX domain-containing protein n=1 Tax=Lunasporangiospora selenospora TaxID=979761 RepID=A0A9P6FZP8_9FUNG|nr:hypothetical protein BGW38_006015 [Lunasporangiospora selenospora]